MSQPGNTVQLGDERLPSRFWSKVELDASGCWLWSGRLSWDGYGCFASGGAHRHAYLALVGPIPANLVTDHLCRVRRCVNPAHIEPVTRKENARRGIFGVLTTHCSNGHEYNEANTYRYRGTRPGRGAGLVSRDCRCCRACNRIAAAASAAKRRRQAIPTITEAEILAERERQLEAEQYADEVDDPGPPPETYAEEIGWSPYRSAP